MNTLRTLLVITLIGCGAIAPYTFAADDATTAEANIELIAAQAETSIASVIPAEAKSFFNGVFAQIERFRLEQVAIAAAKRDALKAVVIAQDVQREESIEENRDKVLEGESQSLYSGAGERLREDVSFGKKAQYYAYTFYAAFVSSPIMFYIVGSFVIVYILTTIFRRFRSRGSVE